MVKEIRIYIEGGGAHKDGKIKLRRGFGVFLDALKEECKARRLDWYLVPCGAHHEACKQFHHALVQYREALCFLLVDADQLVREKAQMHIEGLYGHTFDRGEDGQFHLMAQIMESWFLADPDALEKYFGKGFRAGALPKHADVEAVPKNQVLDALERAAKDTKKGGYHKIRDGAELLQKISPEKVCQRARHCNQLFKDIQQRIANIEAQSR